MSGADRKPSPDKVTTAASVKASGMYADPDPNWLAQLVEEVIEPDLPIVDAHHHLWSRGEVGYLFDDYLSDLESGHRVVSTVYVDCHSMYRAEGPRAMRPLGEVEFANGVAAMSASGGYGATRVCQGIVGYADLRGGDDARRLLEAQMAAGGGRFKGIRQSSAWSHDEVIMRPMGSRPKGLLLDPAFRKGFAHLAPLGLSFDAFLFHPQLGELYDLARQFPDTAIVVDHVGTPLGMSSYSAWRREVFDDWKRSMCELAQLPNVWVKLGGLGMFTPGLDFHARATPPGSAEIAAGWGPFIETCIEAFGPRRVMFESNFPPDKGSCSYRTLWNVFKRIASGYSDEERRDLFSGSAINFYRLSPVLN